jgi:hypothetical protein
MRLVVSGHLQKTQRGWLMIYQKPKPQRNFLLYALLILCIALQIAILHKLSSHQSRPEGLYLNPAVYPQALIYIPPCEESK